LNFSYTTLEPGTHCSLRNTNGPEPTALSICLKASVSAISFGMMNGTLEEILPIESSRSP